MTNKEIIKWLQSLKLEIGRQNNQHLWNYEEALDVAIKVLQENRWIPVSEKPKENGKYIASLEDSVYPEASFFNGKWFMRPLNGIAREFGEYEVIAWMPLPKPYKKNYYCESKQKTGKWKKIKYGYTWTENNVCLNFVDYYDAKEDGNEE